MVLVAGFAEVICKDEVWLWRLDLNRRTPLPARLVQMLQSPDEVHVAIKIGNEKSACAYRKSDRVQSAIVVGLRANRKLLRHSKFPVLCGDKREPPRCKENEV